jgi:hypothetical protein
MNLLKENCSEVNLVTSHEEEIYVMSSLCNQFRGKSCVSQEKQYVIHDSCLSAIK